MNRRIMLIRVLIVLVPWVAGDSLARGQGAATRAARTPTDPKQQGARDGARANLLSEKECRDYAETVVKAMRSGDHNAIDSAIDSEAIFKASTEGFGLPESERQGVIDELQKANTGGLGLTKQLLKNSQEGGRFDSLRTRQNHGRQVILFRMIKPPQTGGVGYFEFVPKRSLDGKIRAADIYSFASGEFISETIHRALLPIVTDRSRSFLAKLLTGEQEYIRDLPKLQQIIGLINQGNMQEALPKFKELSADTRKMKFVLLIHLRAAQSTDEQEYSRVLETFRTNYPKDPGIDLLSIDYFALKKEFDRSLECVDRVDKSVGGDPYLNVIRCGVNAMRGDTAEARRLAGVAIDKDPTLLPAYLSLLGLSLTEKKYDDTLAMLKEIDQKFHVPFNDLSTAPKYAGFVQSPQYPQWLEYLKGKSAAPKAKQQMKARPGIRKRARSNRPQSTG